MIQINQCKLRIPHTEADLEAKIRKILKINPSVKFTYEIRRRSIDARRKPELFYVYQLWVNLPKEQRVIRNAHTPSVQLAKEQSYQPNAYGTIPLKHPPAVIGAGPAGLFCAYLLTELGFTPIVYERGKAVEERQKDVEQFWNTGLLHTGSNVQFGEGGAGTFSDGKLNTAVKDPSGRSRYVLETFVRFGAPSRILYEQKPHIGTDILSQVIANMRKYLVGKGCQFRFETQITDFQIAGSQLIGLTAAQRGPNQEKQTKNEPAEIAVLAIGHSARDTFQKLNQLQIPMEAKNFAVGFRVEHPQKMIDNCMYGVQENRKLPAAPYKVTSNFPNGRGVYSFCMCPGGYVVNSSSGGMQTVVNGMSYSGRNGTNANSAIIISVTTADFGADDALAGMRYQMKLEQKNYELGSGKIPQQLYGDYKNNRTTTSYGEYNSQTKGDTVFANLRGLFSQDMEQSFLLGMEHFSQIIPDFDRADAILSGVESRTSSPLRILRGEGFESTIKGIFPCGEGAGYAGGIMSAAMDGLKIAEAIAANYKQTI